MEFRSRVTYRSGEIKMKAKKLIGIILSAFIALGIFAVFPMGYNMSVPVYAEQKGFKLKTDNDGDKYISGYNGKGGDIVIPKEAVWIGKQAFYGNRSITSVTFPENCWYWIDEQAFAFCPNLKTVNFNGSIGGIGEGAFYACTSLESVTFGGDVSLPSSSGGIGSYAFSGCTSLKSVNFSDPDAKVDMLGGCAFSECVRLKSVTLPSGLGDIYSDVFVNCSALTSIEIPPDAKVKGTHILGYMYGKKTSSSLNSGYGKADGETKRYVTIWEAKDGNYSELSGTVTQKSITVTAAKGSDAAKYAEENGITCNYT